MKQFRAFHISIGNVGSRVRNPALVGSLVGLALLAGCSDKPAPDDPAASTIEQVGVTTATLTGGLIGPGNEQTVNIRMTPFKPGNYEADNACISNSPQVFKYATQPVLVKTADESGQPVANAPWIGFTVLNVSALSDTKCAGDPSGVVWVSNADNSGHVSGQVLYGGQTPSATPRS